MSGRAAAAAVFLAAIVAALAVTVAVGGLGTGSVDARLVRDAHTLMLAHPAAVTVCRALTWLGAPLVADIIVGVAALLLWRRHQRADAVYVVAVRAVAQLFSTLLKVVIGRPRPDLVHPLIHVSGFSFPSGHATGAASAYLPVAVVLCATARRAGVRRGVAAGAVVICLIVAATRVLLGAHYPSDVLGGLALGASVTAGLWAVRTAWFPVASPLAGND